MSDFVDLVSSGDEEENDFKKYRIEIAGEPKSMPRPNFMAWMQNGVLRRQVTNPAKNDIEALRNSFKTLMQGKYNHTKFPMFDWEPVSISMCFYLRFPNKVFKKNDRSKGFKVGRPTRNGRWPITKVPDIDNLAKFVLDALNGVVHKDDKQVSFLCLFKVGDSCPPHEGRTIVRFHQIATISDVDPPTIGPENFLNDDAIVVTI